MTETILLPISDLTPYPGNPRRGNVDAIKDSLEANGQFRPLVVQAGTNYVLAGNHTLQAAEALGWTEVACWLLEVDDDKAKRIVLADNRTSDLGWYDDNDLLSLLNGLDEAGGLAGTGYGYDDLTDLQNLAGLADFDPSAGFIDGDLGTEVGAAGVGRDKSMEEKFDAYAAKGVRNIILAYPLDQYEDANRYLTAAREQAAVDNNADAVLAALRAYTGGKK